MKEIVMLIGLALLFLASRATFAQTAEELFQQGVQLEEVKGELAKAIEVYKDILSMHTPNKSVAARSLLHLGKCYEKLGQRDAQRAYERILKEFGDQTEVVAEARARLASLSFQGKKGGAARTAGHNAGMGFRKIDFPENQSTHLARLSPDGNRLLYVHVQGKRPQFSLHVKDFSTGQDKLLVEEVEVGEYAFFVWSPDGKKVVYKHGAGELRVINSDGGETQTLWRSADSNVVVLPLDWSRDGRNLLLALFQPVEWRLRLALLSASGGEPRSIVAGGASEIYEHARFSPDGRYIVGQKSRDGNTDLFIWSTDGNLETRLTDHAAKEDYPFWSPDGKYIVFTSDKSKTVDLWAIPMRGAEPAGPPVLVKRNLGQNICLTEYTPSGILTMYMLSEGGVSDLFVLPVDSLTGEARGKFLPFARYPTAHFMPRWSPDGRRVVYTSRKGNIGTPKIYLSSGSEKEDQEIPQRDYYVVNVEWSRDGEYLIFPGFRGLDPQAQVGIFCISLKDFGIESLYAGDRPTLAFEGAFVNLQWLPQAKTFMFEKLVKQFKGSTYRRGIYRMDGDCKNTQLVTDKILADVYTWPSPDGRHIAYLEQLHLKLWSLERDTSVATLVQFAEGRIEGPAWSPDGNFVAYKDKKQLNVFSLSGNTSRVLVEVGKKSEIGGRAYYGGLAWSPDGKWIGYVVRDTSTSSKAPHELWKVPAAGGVGRKLADAPPLYPLLGELTWHPGGKMIVVTGQSAEAESRSYEHWALENFLPTRNTGK
jgi:Tol biopolymer transport system component